LALPPLWLGLPEVPDSRSPMYVQVYTGRPPTLSQVPYRASRRAPGIPSPCRAASISSRGEHPVAHRAFHRAANIPSRTEHSIARRTSRRAPSIPSRGEHPVARETSHCADHLVSRRAFGHGSSILSLRPYDARDHIAQFCCAIRSRGQSCALMSCARQGAIYSGGRLGIAAAGVRVAWVGVSSHTLSGAANPKVRLN
jgi:hypothetical protein